MAKKKNSPVPIIIGMVVLVAVVVAGYLIGLQIKEKKNKEKADNKYTETEVLLGIDLDESYPLTSRDVLKLYSRISMCLHNDTDISAEDFEALVKMMRELFDTELLSINPENGHITALMEEATAYAEAGMRISDYAITSVNNILSWSAEGESFESMVVCYTVTGGVVSESSYQKFLLRYDKEHSRWKILGWEAATADDMK